MSILLTHRLNYLILDNVIFNHRHPHVYLGLQAIILLDVGTQGMTIEVQDEVNNTPVAIYQKFTT